MSVAVRVLLLMGLVTVLSGCQIIEGILQIGFWAGVLTVVGIVVAVLLAVRFFQRGT